MDISFSRYYLNSDGVNSEHRITLSRRPSLCKFGLYDSDSESCDFVIRSCDEVREAINTFNVSFSSNNIREPFYSLFNNDIEGLKKLERIIGLLCPYLHLLEDFYDEKLIDEEIWKQLTEIIPGQTVLDWDEVSKGTVGNQVVFITDNEFNSLQMEKAYIAGAVGRIMGSVRKDMLYTCYWIESDDADTKLNFDQEIKRLAISRINAALRENFAK